MLRRDRAGDKTNRRNGTGGSTMASSANRILTTHVGSLVRPPQLIEFLHKIEDGEPYDRTAYEVALQDAIETVVHRQADAGIDIVSDGEFSKGRNWAFYVHDRLTGVVSRPPKRKSPAPSCRSWHRRAHCPTPRTNTTRTRRACSGPSPTACI